MTDSPDDFSEPSESLVSLWASKVEGQGHAILFVDDEPDTLSFLEAAFRSRYRVLIAASAEEARPLIQSNTVQAVFSDQMMPGENGVEFLAWVRDAHPLTTRVLMTAHRDVDACQSSINRSHVRYLLIKPVDKLALEKAVRLSVATSVIARRYRDAVTT